MALPTLSTRVPSRFHNPGEYMDWERERKAEKQHQLEAHAHHLERQNICTERHAAWTSTQCYNKSVLEYQKQCLKEERRTDLELRRNRLRTFLQEQTNRLEAELRDMVSNMATRKGRHQQKLQERNLARRDRTGKVEPEVYEGDDVGQRQEQLPDREQLQVSEQEEDGLFENEYETPQSEVLERMMQADEKKKCEEKRRMDNRRRQIEELKLWEAEMVQLNEEQKALAVKQMQLEKIQEERKELEERQKKPEMRRFLVHHYRTQMFRRGEQVQEELEGDRNILATMMEGEEEENTKGLAWVRSVIEERLQLERKREVKIDDLRWQGAQRVWDEQELQWEEERKSRGLLMTEVLSERTQQLAAKTQKNREAQEECWRRRAELIQELDRQGS